MRGEGTGASREYGVKFQTAITRKRLEITLCASKLYIPVLNRVRAIDWNRFRGSTTTYKGDSGSWSGFGPWTTGNGWE